MIEAKATAPLPPEGHSDNHSPMSAADKSRKQFGDDIAYGLQQTLFCLATDTFADPWIGHKIQERFETKEHHGTLKDNFIGEIAGDTAALGLFLVARKAIPQAFEPVKELARKCFGERYERNARKQLQHWVEEHNVDPNSERYKQRLNQLIDRQADDVAKTSFIAAGSVGANMIAQRHLGNTHTWPVLFMSKLAGATLTALGVLGVRRVLPKATKQLDDELSDKYFQPVIRATQRALGAEVSAKTAEGTETPPDASVHAEREMAKRKTALEMAAINASLTPG